MLIARWRQLANSVLARNTIWVAIGQGLRIGIQAVYFVLIARALGAREYGAYIGVVALVAIAAPFSSLGAGNLLIKHVVRNPGSFTRHWGKALATTLLSGTILLVVIAVVARAWLPSSIPLQLVLMVGAADLLFVRLLDVSAQAYQAHQRLSRTALLQLLLSPVRLVAAVLLIATVPSPTAVQWGSVYALSALLGSAVAVLLVNRELGKPEFHLRELGGELREGVFFAVCVSAQSSLLDIDKAMLARLVSLEATGVYAAADRLVAVAFLPIASLQVATYARFFEHGARGVRDSAQLARRLFPLAASYGILAGAALYLLAPFWPLVLGDEYQQAIPAVRWLAVLPLLKAVHFFGADALTGAGYQGTRTMVHVSIALVNVLLNAWFIPLFSWRGAAAASVISNVLMGLGIWGSVWYLARYERQFDSPEHERPIVAAG